MKKLLLAAVFMFALSQVSFAATSFADLLRQEKASSSFIPKIEVEKFTTTILDEKSDEWTLTEDEKVEYWTTWCRDNDDSHGWELARQRVYLKNEWNPDERLVLSDNVYPNDPGDECKSTRVLVYDSAYTDKNWYFDEYYQLECVEHVPDDGAFCFDSTRYVCKEYKKEAPYVEGKVKVTTYQEEDTCYEKWDD